MKKFATLSILSVGVALALSACEAWKSGDYTEEQAAPYAHERTVGTVEQPVVTRRAEPVYKAMQTK